LGKSRVQTTPVNGAPSPSTIAPFSTLTCPFCENGVSFHPPSDFPSNSDSAWSDTHANTASHARDIAS
jgi:hypothetical protein